VTTEDTTRHVEQVMGMPVTLVLRGRHTNDAIGLGAWADVVTFLHKVDRTFSTYREDSEISQLNNGTRRLDDVSPEVAQVLAIGEQARVASDGAFDVWFERHGGSRRLDPSGVVKGWSIERAARLLERLDGTNFCLSAGGDMVCRTRVPGSVGWQIGIEDPHDPTRVLAVIPVTNGAIATSGTTHRGTHLVDARTGRAPEGIASVTVITESLTWADIDATAAFAHGPDAAKWLATRPNRTALIVWDDGSTTPVRTAPMKAA